MAQYADIVAVNVHPPYAPGAYVTFSVDVKNLYSSPITVALTGVLGASNLSFSPSYRTINPGITEPFAATFTVPSISQKLEVWSWWWGSDGKWHSDDYGSVQVTVTAVDTVLKSVELNVTRGTYGVNQPIAYNLEFTYKGPAQQCTMYFAYGTGAYPSFSQKGILRPLQISPEDTIVFSLPACSSDTNITKVGTFCTRWALEEGRAYSVKVNLDTANGVHGEDIDFNAFIFSSGAQPGMQTLEVDITPAGSGYVTTSPASNEGKSTWNNGDTGTFPDGTDVQVTAHPNSGYKFDHWSDEIVGGTSTSNPAYVQTMTEHRAVKAHFVEITMQKLEIDITPIGRGYVVTNPASNEGRTEWSNGDTGYFPDGTTIQVTAIPYQGYEFDHWSDEIQGGISYQNPAYVKPMTEHRAVKLHLREVGNGGVDGVTFSDLQITGWGKSLSPLGSSPVSVAAGESLYVGFLLQYTAEQAGTVELWVSLVVSPGRDRTWKFSVPLQAGADLTVEDTVEIPISSTDPNLKNQTYDLWVEINNVIDAKESGAVTVTGMPEGFFSGIGDLILVMIVMMLMQMMMSFMESPGGFIESAGEKARKVAKAAKPVVQIFTGKGGKGE